MAIGLLFWEMPSEQEQYAGWIELMMTAAFPDRDVTFGISAGVQTHLAAHHDVA